MPPHATHTATLVELVCTSMARRVDFLSPHPAAHAMADETAGRWATYSARPSMPPTDRLRSISPPSPSQPRPPDDSSRQVGELRELLEQSLHSQHAVGVGPAGMRDGSPTPLSSPPRYGDSGTSDYLDPRQQQAFEKLRQSQPLQPQQQHPRQPQQQQGYSGNDRQDPEHCIREASPLSVCDRLHYPPGVGPPSCICRPPLLLRASLRPHPAHPSSYFLVVG